MSEDLLAENKRLRVRIAELRRDVKAAHEIADASEFKSDAKSDTIAALRASNKLLLVENKRLKVCGTCKHQFIGRMCGLMADKHEKQGRCFDHERCCIDSWRLAGPSTRSTSRDPLCCGHIRLLWRRSDGTLICRACGAMLRGCRWVPLAEQAAEAASYYQGDDDD